MGLLWWRRPVTIHSHAQIHMDRLGRSRVIAGMARRSIHHFKGRLIVLRARDDRIVWAQQEASEESNRIKKQKCCLNGWWRYPTTFHSGNIFGLYVNSWGLNKKPRVCSQGNLAAYFLCAMQNSVSKAREIANSKGDSFEHLCFVVAPFCETVRPRETNGI